MKKRMPALHKNLSELVPDFSKHDEDVSSNIECEERTKKKRQSMIKKRKKIMGGLLKIVFSQSLFIPKATNKRRGRKKSKKNG